MPFTQHVCCCTSIQAAADIAQFTLIGLDGNPCREGKPALGAADVDAVAGEMATANVLGIMVVLVGAAVAVGDTVQSNADGMAVPRGAAVANVLPAAVGIALDVATAKGDLIRILRGA